MLTALKGSQFSFYFQYLGKLGMYHIIFTMSYQTVENILLVQKCVLIFTNVHSQEKNKTKQNKKKKTKKKQKKNNKKTNSFKHIHMHSKFVSFEDDETSLRKKS